MDTNLQTRIAELEAWLQHNHPEHMARPMIENDLRALRKELEEQSSRTFERDTFEIRNHQFNIQNE
jgi:hypothetical protein